MTQQADVVSVRDQIVPAEPGKSFFDALRTTGADSFEAQVDIQGGLPHVKVERAARFGVFDPSSIAELRAALDREQTRISALLIATDFGGDEAGRHIDWAVRTAHAARELGVPVVRIDTLTANKQLSPEQVRDAFIHAIRQVISQTRDTGVDLGMENHGPISNDPKFLDAVLDAVPDSQLGLTLDTGNFYWWGHPIDEVYRLVSKYAPRAKHTHIKNINFPPEVGAQARAIGYEYKQFCCAVDEGNLDLPQIVRILRESGYGRALCIEDESLFKVPESQRLPTLRREVSSLRRAAESVAMDH